MRLTVKILMNLGAWNKCFQVKKGVELSLQPDVGKVSALARDSVRVRKSHGVRI